MDYVTFTLIVDDIVWPDGHTAMACLGGGGPQTAFAIRMWTSGTQAVGFAAGVGDDLPQSCKDWFEAMRVDTQGLMLWTGFQTLRAWQVLEADGRRTQVWRTPAGEEVWGMLRPKLSTLPDSYRKARAYHVGVHPSGLDVDFIRELRASGAEVVSIEPYTHAVDVVPRAELEALLASAHVFSPNEQEAFSLVGPGEPLEVIGRLVEAGAQVVCLRRGELGCVVHRADTRETWHVPAVDMAITTADDCLQYASGRAAGQNGPREPATASSSRELNRAEAGSDLPDLTPEAELDSVTAGQSLTEEPGCKGDRGVTSHNEGASQESERGGRSGIAVNGANGGTDSRLVVKPGRVKDPTGCGNAFCGGFVVGWLEHRDLLTGALYGSVAASFMLEHEGIPPPSRWRYQEACHRLEVLKTRAQRLQFDKESLT